MTKGSRLEDWRILKETVEEVALTPATVPLSLKTPTVMAPVLCPVKTKPGVKLAAPEPPLATESWPVHPGTKVRVSAVVVLMLIRMLVSEEVATWRAEPVRPETEVKAEVK